MKCKKDSGKMCGAGWRNSMFDLQGIEREEKVEEKGITGDFTLEERMVILYYVQWHLQLITEEEYIV